MTPEFWKPTCDIAVLHLRAAALRAVRTFFDGRGYLEVETPLLSHDIVVDAHLEPFSTTSSDNQTLYLQTSPEAGMKRLLAADSGSIFQVTRSFRKGEQGRRHNSEFTMVEWYGVETTYHDQMQLTEDLVRSVAIVVADWHSEQTSPPLIPTQLPRQPFSRTSYDTAFQMAASGVLDLSAAELQTLAEQHTSIGNTAQQITDRDDLLNLLLAECVEPNLGKPRPQFLCDYPISQAALAEQRDRDPRTACRFELYINGLELCNGYQELTDPTELKRRDQQQNASRSAHHSEPLPGAPRMAAAMQAGLSKCSGVALGFDRLLMSLTGCNEIAQVMPFPADHA